MLMSDNSNVWYLDRGKNFFTEEGKDLFNTIKNVDLDSVQKGITNIQKTIGLLQDIGVGGSKNVPEQVYRPRPMYKYFED